MNNLSTLEIITITGIYFQGKIHSLSANTIDGEIGVLPNHSKLITILKDDSYLTFRTNEDIHHKIQIDKATLFIEDNKIKIIANKIK